MTSVPAIVALATIVCWTLVMAPKSVTFQRHDYLLVVAMFYTVALLVSRGVTLLSAMNCITVHTQRWFDNLISIETEPKVLLNNTT